MSLWEPKWKARGAWSREWGTSRWFTYERPYNRNLELCEHNIHSTTTQRSKRRTIQKDFVSVLLTTTDMFLTVPPCDRGYVTQEALCPVVSSYIPLPVLRKRLWKHSDPGYVMWDQSAMGCAFCQSHPRGGPKYCSRNGTILGKTLFSALVR
jgi:hypothetical protein